MENRKYVTLLAPVISLGLFLIWSTNIFGYESETHAFLTDTTIKFYDKNFPNQKIDSELTSYVLDGTRREDDPPRWMNHFYDPVYERGLTQDAAIDPAYQLGNWQESKQWAQDSANQNKIKYSPIIATILSSIQSGKIEKFFPTADFTWHEALRYWIQGDKEMAMFTLGHIIHLIQDASVPDHTRNDPHPGDSPYEKYTSQYTLSNPDIKLSQNIKSDKPTTLPDLNSYFTELATYSNNNFYSKDTIGIQSGYGSPQPDIFEPISIGNQTEFYLIKKDIYGNSYYLAVKKSIGHGYIIENTNTVSIDNLKVKADYWPLLSLKAVEYSAGVINLFFQEVEKNKNNPEFTKKESPTFLAQVAETVKNGWDATKNFVVGVFGNGVSFETISDIPTDVPSQTNINQETSGNQNQTGQSAVATENKSREKTYKVTRVIDGDTIVLEDGTVVRYIGIDAPELSDKADKSDCLAKEARDRNKELVLNKDVHLDYGSQKTDAYDRTLAYVWVNNSLVNQILIQEGFGYAFNFNHKHAKQDDFESAQKQAKELKLGIWGPACGKSNLTATGTEEIKSENNPPVSIGFCQFSTSKLTTHQELIINEVAWMGTQNSASDEWIELKNISNSSLNISGYQIVSKDNDIEIDLGKSKALNINANGLILLERTDDDSVPDIPADLIYTGSLANSDDGLRLFNSNCDLIDEILASPSWPAGNSESKNTAERDSNGFGWHTSSIVGGTPKGENSYFYSSSGGGGGGGNSSLPTDQQQKPPPQFYPIVINEIMYNPEGTDSGREWIELYNTGTSTADISDWKLFESGTNHSLTLLSGMSDIRPGEYAVISNGTSTTQFQNDFPGFSGNLFKSSLSLNNDGESISVKNGDLKIDEISYSPTQGANGNGKSLQKFESEWKESSPTPGKINKIDAKNTLAAEIPNHLVISEIQTSGESTDDKFVEIYNPTQNPIPLSGHSLQYLSGSATSTQNTRIIVKEISNTLSIPPLKFFLLAKEGGRFTNADALFSYSISKESGIVFLVNSSSTITSVNDPRIIDFVAYGNVALSSITTLTAPLKNQSIERLAIGNGLCTSASNSGEFLGNACDTEDNATDFEIRINPRPQRLVNLAEPRTAPNPVQNFIASYSTSTLQISTSWQLPTENGASQPFTYEVKDADADTFIATSTLLSVTKTIDEIGRNYQFAVSAIDPEGLASPTATSSINISSFLSLLQIFRDPQDSTKYILEGRYDNFPFVPNLYAERTSWSGSILVFFLNHDAAKTIYIEGGYPSTPSTADILLTDYKHCSGNPGSRNIFVVSDSPCPQGGMLNDGLPHEYFEDNKFSIKALPQTSLSSSDYITVAFYAFDHSNAWSGGTEIFKLAAIDKTKYYFNNSMPEHQPPLPIKNFVTEIHDDYNNPHVLLKWDETTDPDSIDQFITYEYAISTSIDTIGENEWQKTYRGMAQTTDSQGRPYLYQIGPEIPLTSTGNYTFYIRAKDELGLASDPATSTASFIIPEFITGISETTCEYCDTTGFVTTEGSQDCYKLGQRFVLNNSSLVNQITLEIHNFANTPSSFDAKIAVYSMASSTDPNAGMQEIYSATLTNLPKLYWPNANYVNVKIPSPLQLAPGNYFISLESVGTPTAPGQVLMASRTRADKYPAGSMYGIYGTIYDSTLSWHRMGVNLFFRILGLIQN